MRLSPLQSRSLLALLLTSHALSTPEAQEQSSPSLRATHHRGLLLNKETKQLVKKCTCSNLEFSSTILGSVTQEELEVPSEGSHRFKMLHFENHTPVVLTKTNVKTLTDTCGCTVLFVSCVQEHFIRCCEEGNEGEVRCLVYLDDSVACKDEAEAESEAATATTTTSTTTTTISPTNTTSPTTSTPFPGPIGGGGGPPMGISPLPGICSPPLDPITLEGPTPEACFENAACGSPGPPDSNEGEEDPDFCDEGQLCYHQRGHCEMPKRPSFCGVKDADTGLLAKVVDGMNERYLCEGGECEVDEDCEDGMGCFAECGPQF